MSSVDPWPWDKYNQLKEKIMPKKKKKIVKKKKKKVKSKKKKKR